MKERLLFGFKRGVAAALLAPTALNKQNFQIYGKGDEVSIAYEPGTFAGEDLGLVKYIQARRWQRFVPLDVRHDPAAFRDGTLSQ